VIMARGGFVHGKLRCGVSGRGPLMRKKRWEDKTRDKHTNNAWQQTVGSLNGQKCHHKSRRVFARRFDAICGQISQIWVSLKGRFGADEVFAVPDGRLRT